MTCSINDHPKILAFFGFGFSFKNSFNNNALPDLLIFSSACLEYLNAATVTFFVNIPEANTFQGTIAVSPSLRYVLIVFRETSRLFLVGFLISFATTFQRPNLCKTAAFLNIVTSCLVPRLVGPVGFIRHGFQVSL